MGNRLTGSWLACVMSVSIGAAVGGALLLLFLAGEQLLHLIHRVGDADLGEVFADGLGGKVRIAAEAVVRTRRSIRVGASATCATAAATSSTARRPRVPAAGCTTA